MRKIFKKDNIYVYEFFDSSSAINYKYPSPVLTSSAIEFINTCDLVIVFSGSILNLASAEALEQLEQLKPYKILLGASAAGYCDFENHLCKLAAEKFDTIFLRDFLTGNTFFTDCDKIRYIIDLAFFAGDSIVIPPEKGDYAIVNINPICDNREVIKKKVDKLSEKYKTVYVVENTTRYYNDVPNYLYIGYWDTLYKLYANAAYVVTNRVHTSVVCVKNAIPFSYVGLDCSHPNGKRSSLFETIGFELETDKDYSKEFLKGFGERINAEKVKTEKLLTDFFKNWSRSRLNGKK